MALNPPDGKPLAVTAAVPLSGNAYVSVSCENTGPGIYPEDFKPKPGRLAVQVTKGNAEAISRLEICFVIAVQVIGCHAFRLDCMAPKRREMGRR